MTAKEITRTQACKTLDQWRQELQVAEEDNATVSMFQDEENSSSAPSIPPPAHLLDPISHMLFKDPVITKYGQTYERETIERWINEHGKNDPITRQPLELTDLIPNIAMRSSVEEWKKSQTSQVQWWN